MKKIMLGLALIALVVLAAASALAQAPAAGQISLGAGLDVMLPIGKWGDAVGTGFGATGELDYAFSIHTSITGKIGYLSWSTKDLPAGMSSSYSGVPLLIGVKYYPHLTVSQEQSPLRFYGHFEIGFMFGSTSTSVNVYGRSISGSASSTDITLVPSVGVEIPAGPNGCVDISVRYFDIKSNGNLGLRAGYKLTI